MNAGDDLAGYLEKTSGIPVAFESVPADRLKGLPVFVTHAYSFRAWTWMGHRLLLAESRAGAGDSAPARIADHVSLLRAHFEADVVMVFPALDAYRRDRFVHLGIPFIIPGQQLFIPPFVSLVERFRPVERPEKLTIPAQVVVLYQLLRRPPEAALLNQWGAWVGYSAMTLSNVRNELAALGLCAVGPGEKPRGLRFLYQGRALWDAARDALRTPVRRMQWTILRDPRPDLLQAGITALSRLTMLSDDKVPTYACRDAIWRLVQQGPQAQSAALPDEATARIEIWRYRPEILGKDGMVDRLSLYLSLADHPDERVRSAANALLEGVPW